jgi:LmbE family N-acetylglucosaminyl deacetylase
MHDTVNSILAVVAHPDDEVLGCGGYLAKRSRMGDAISVLCISDGVSSRSEIDVKDNVRIRRDSARRAGNTLGIGEYYFGEYDDNRLDGVDLLDIVKYIEKISRIARPNLVITHFQGDLNVDHSRVSQATITAFRPVPDSQVKRILFFETPSSTEWNFSGIGNTFSPNWFEDISEDLETKISALSEYSLELREFPHPRSFQSIRALASLRGATCGFESAEAFVLGYNIA